jgi:hypothetical protein
MKDEPAVKSLELEPPSSGGGSAGSAVAPHARGSISVGEICLPQDPKNPAALLPLAVADE